MNQLKLVPSVADPVDQLRVCIQELKDGETVVMLETSEYFEVCVCIARRHLVAWNDPERFTDPNYKLYEVRSADDQGQHFVWYEHPLKGYGTFGDTN